MASLKRKQTLFSGVARKAKEIRQNSTNLAFDNKTNARKGSKIATADARLAIYVFYLSMVIRAELNLPNFIIIMNDDENIYTT